MPADRLPTGWLRDVPTASVRLDPDGDRLTIRMPSGLVPVRRYAQVRVHRGAYGAIQIDVLHQERFTSPKPGRNAWQSGGYEFRDSVRRPGNRLKLFYRDLARRRYDLVGEGHAVEALYDRLRGVESLDVLVRVTPEGFQLLVCEDPQTRGVGERLSMANDPIHLVREALNHGAGLAARAYAANPREFQHPNCRCTVVEEKETEDMKTDSTTSDTLPFGLIAGEAIVQCEFSDGASKDYAYFAGGLELAKGDYVVVASPYGEGGAVYDEESGGYLKVVRVTSTDTNAEGVRKAAKWIIGKVDVAEYRDRRRRVEELKLLDEQIAVAKREAMKALELKQLMELSPELATLIAKRFEVAGVPLEAEKPSS